MSVIKFQNPTNGYIEEVNKFNSGVWTLLFGCFYFMFKGIWVHALISFVLAIITGGISWLIYPFFAGGIVVKNYRQRGWIEVTDTPASPPGQDLPISSMTAAPTKDPISPGVEKAAVVCACLILVPLFMWISLEIVKMDSAFGTGCVIGVIIGTPYVLFREFKKINAKERNIIAAKAI